MAGMMATGAVARKTTYYPPAPPRTGARPAWSRLPRMLIGLALALPGPGVAQNRLPSSGELARGTEREATLSGCGVALPGQADRDSGLAERYAGDRQGQSFLFAPSLSLRQTISDNVTLAPDDEETDLATTLIPAVSYCQNIPRLTASFDYQAELIHYADDSSRNDIFHQANASATATILRDRLFLDVSGDFDQQPESFDSPFATDNELITGNRTDALRFEVSPRFIQGLGPLGTSVTRYAFRTAQFSDSDQDTRSHTASFRLTSPQAADPLSWIASVRSERVQTDRTGARGDTEDLDDAFLELGYRISGGLSVLGRAGLETVNRRDGSIDRFGGEYWEAGLRWSDPNTRLEARYGNRFFGDTFSASIRRESGPLSLSARYSETQEIRQANTGIPNDQRDLFRAIFGEIPENQVVINKRLNLSASYETALSTIEVTGFDERRDFVTSGGERQRTGLDTSWRWRLFTRTTLTPRVTWERVDQRDGAESEQYGLRMSVARMLTPSMQAGLTLRHQERDSNQGTDEFVENALVLEITRLF